MPNLLMLITREFAGLVLVSNLIGLPVAFYFVRYWLESFAYKIDISPDIFILSGSLALAIALLTVSYRAFRAASTNPVESLRYD